MTFAIGTPVDTPEGPGRVTYIRRSGYHEVTVDGLGPRQYLAHQMKAMGPAPATPPVTPHVEPSATPGPYAVPSPDQETSLALDRLESEAETAAQRRWRAWRLELVQREFPSWAFQRDNP